MIFIIYLESACYDKQNGGQNFNLPARIVELWRFKIQKVEKLHEEDHQTIFKPGLWQTGFLVWQEWYYFQQKLMVNKIVV